MADRGPIATTGWTTEALDVVSLACEHYGGMKTWRALRAVRLLPKRLSGLVPWLKGVGNTFPLPSRFDIYPHQQATRFIDYPAADHVGIFDNGSVRIERMLDGAVVERSDAQRETFRGIAGARRWAPLDALYFFGYALTNYHSLPFTLFDGRLISARTTGARHARTSILELELPAGLHTHSPRQTFYFDPRGRLIRHDYHAEVVGYWARGAHYWNRQESFSGLPVSLDRHVVARVGAYPTPITALRATFSSAEVELEPGT